MNPSKQFRHELFQVGGTTNAWRPNNQDLQSPSDRPTIPMPLSFFGSSVASFQYDTNAPHIWSLPLIQLTLAPLLVNLIWMHSRHSDAFLLLP